ncbi:MAG: hypothetical protein ACKVOL_02390 [Novosphingobium sp.]
MMDEIWMRRWMEARDAARQAREAQQAEAARTGKPVPTVWGDLRALVRDLIHPPHRRQADETCEAKTCQSAA